MPVFISYRHTDRSKAVEIAQVLDNNNIEYYLDVIDDESKSTNDITEVITQNIKKCTHLLAVISPNTSKSWWVPFEIGEATISNRRICTYAFENSHSNIDRYFLNQNRILLPEYLQKWPILFSESDLNKFIENYKNDHILRSVFESRRGEPYDNLTKSGADRFHNNLMSQL